ncbi:MAG: response regulator, partial [Leptospiraceae bacterium]|nr:response regulator [Leptospiraceae bacterium]
MKKIYQILLIEDDRNLASLASHHLEKFNFEVEWAENGKKALELVQNNHYDLILSDIKMPEMDGMTFLEKSSNYVKRTPIILLTSAGDKEYVKKAQAYHASAYLLKPVLPPKLLEKVKAILELEDEDVFEKKLFPLVIQGMEQGKEFVLEIKGCMTKNFQEEWKKVIDSATFQSLRIKISEEFFCHPNSLKNLELCLETIIQPKKISTSNIVIESKYFKTL